MEGFTGAGLAIELRGGDGDEGLWAKKTVSMGCLQGVCPAKFVGLNLAIAAVPALFHPSNTLHTFTVLANNASAVDAPAPAPAQPKFSLLTRIRTDFSSLNASRFRTVVHVAGKCKLCGKLETREHYLYHCLKYVQQRATLLSTLPTHSLPPLGALLSSAAFLPPLLTFLASSARPRSPRRPLWELLDDVAIHVTATTLDSVRQERLAQDARCVANGGPLLDPHRPIA
ncbi:hypothetical protein JCM8097_005305 [Rhodosporidiobolus ruineniae]